MIALKNTLPQSDSIWLKLIHSDSTWWWQPSWILPSWIQPFCTKKSSIFTHSFSLNLMISAILNSAMLDSDTAILDSDTLLFSLRFTQKHSPSTLTLTQTNSIWINLMMATIFNSAILDSAILHKTLTQTNSIWLKLIHSHSTWWNQPSWTLPCWIQTLHILDSDTLLSSLRFTQKHSHSGFSQFALWLKLVSIGLKLIHSDSTWWWQPSWTLPCWIQTLPSWIQTPCYLPSDSLKNTLTPLWLLTQTNSIWHYLNDDNHLEFCHLGFSHLVIFSQIHSKTLSPILS